MGIYDIFRLAAEGIEHVPWRARLLVGAGGGAVLGGMTGDKDTPITSRIARGAFVGAGLGLLAGGAIRGIGAGATAGGNLGKYAGAKEFTALKAGFKAEGFKGLMRPFPLAVGGAIAGAAIAGPDNRLQGAAIGAGIGFAAMPVKKVFSAYGALGHVPGAKTAVLATAAAGAVIAGSIIRNPEPQAGAYATPGIGGTIDYEPISSGMQDRMYAMNASGDITLGLNNRRHG
jgi:hypothetical protein